MIAVTVQASGEAYVALVVGAAPEVRDSVALDALEAADAIPALDGLVLDFDHYGPGRRAADHRCDGLDPRAVPAGGGGAAHRADTY